MLVANGFIGFDRVYHPPSKTGRRVVTPASAYAGETWTSELDVTTVVTDSGDGNR
jgi:hypothetical protein